MRRSHVGSPSFCSAAYVTMAKKWGALDRWYTLIPQREGWQAESLVEKDDGRLHHLSIMQTCQPCPSLILRHSFDWRMIS